MLENEGHFICKFRCHFKISAKFDPNFVYFEYNKEKTTESANLRQNVTDFRCVTH